MKPLLSATVSVVVASGFAILLSYEFGARGQTLAIIALVSSVVSGTTAYFTAGLAEFCWRRKDNRAKSPVA